MRRCGQEDDTGEAVMAGVGVDPPPPCEDGGHGATQVKWSCQVLVRIHLHEKVAGRRMTGEQ